jgi:hypothetical protein
MASLLSSLSSSLVCLLPLPTHTTTARLLIKTLLWSVNEYKEFDPDVVSHAQDNNCETCMAQEAEQMVLSTTLYYNIVISTLIGDLIPAKLNQSYPSQETFMVIADDFAYNY